eukprot:TRINITY_DN75096_c0_g1_i1.p1 TRINITY_DN75096_c0_g1~~TRINITY_DN75096_c0_g1_i1.p1  ORF type:complete len:168 (+),score=16.95 TRINITY_DN75096_c0_g1_i1:47-550(+)
MWCQAIFSLLLIACFSGVSFADEATFDREQGRVNCRAILQYSAGAGSLTNFVQRFSSYFSETGSFEVPGGKTVDTAEKFVDETIKVWGQYETFNHVFYVEEPSLSGNLCVVPFYQAYLAHNGACGPLIRKGVGIMGLSADSKRVTSWKDIMDVEAVRAEMESCKPAE